MTGKKLLIAAVTTFMCLGLTGNTGAKLKDFKDGVDKSGHRKSDSSKKKKDSSLEISLSNGGPDNTTGASCSESCFGCIFNMTVMLWAYHNLSVYYSSYPYADTKIAHFIYYLPRPKKTESPGDDFKLTITVDEKKNDGKPEEPVPATPPPGFDHTWYITADFGGQWARDEGSGGFIGLSARVFRLLSFECEAKRIMDGEDYLDYYAAGISVPLFQANNFSPDFYFQYAAMNGVVQLSGFAFGFIINSYPVKPLHLMMRIGKHLYTKKETEEFYREIEFIDVEGRIGVLIGRCELFAGYRHIETDHAALGGPIGGIRIWF